MTLSVDTPIKASDINIELGKGSTTQFKIGDADIRSLVGKPTGSFKASDFRGKSAATIFAPANLQGFATGLHFASATLSIFSNGTVQVDVTQDGIGDPNTSYVNPTSAASRVSYKIVNYSGTTPSGTISINTLYTATTNRSLSIQTPYDGNAFALFQIQWYLDGQLKSTTDVEFDCSAGGLGGGAGGI